MVQNNSFIYCKTCDKRFSGPEPYQQHLNSQKHKNKAGIVLDSSQPPVDDILHCDVCDVNISGPIPYAQHMEGSKHKSQLNKNKIVAELSASGGAESEETSLYPNLTNVDSPQPISSGIPVTVLKCELCGMCFSGPESMKDHLESKGHKRKMELENWKPILGQNLVPASAPPIQALDIAADGDSNPPVPAIENAPELSDQKTDGKQQATSPEKQKHKKPLGCFGLFRRSSSKNSKKDRQKKKLETV